MNTRTAKSFPDEAILCCQAGNAALKGNLHESAAMSYRQALAMNPMLWEAFEGLCAIGWARVSHNVKYNSDGFPGDVPPIDDLFPPRPDPVLRKPGDMGAPSKPIPVATGAGFFTPEAGNGGNLFRGWKDLKMGAFAGPRDSMSVHSSSPGLRLMLTHDSGTTDSSFYGEASFQGSIRASRSQPTTLAVQPPAVRPLSSADEAGPVTKKLRSTVRQRTAPPSTTAADTHLKASKSVGAMPIAGPASGPGLAGDRTKSSKARARPALTNANIFSSSGPAQNAAASSRSQAIGIGKPPAAATTRRSSRLQSGSSKAAKVVISLASLLCCVNFNVSFCYFLAACPRSTTSRREDTFTIGRVWIRRRARGF